MLHRASERIWYSDPVEATDRPLLGYIRGDRLCLMVDAGCSAGHANGFLGLLAQNGLPQPDLAVITHSHWDHTYGLSALHDAGVLSIASAATKKDLEKDTALKWSRKLLEDYMADGTVAAFCGEHMLAEYDDPAQINVALPQIAFEGRLVIDLGGERACIFPVENPHAPDSVAIYVPGQKALFLGDAVYEELLGSEWADHSDKVLALLNAICPLDFSCAFTGHGVGGGPGLMTRSELLMWLRERV